MWDTVSGPHRGVPFSVGTTRQKHKSGFGVGLNVPKLRLEIKLSLNQIRVKIEAEPPNSQLNTDRKVVFD